MMDSNEHIDDYRPSEKGSNRKVQPMKFERKSFKEESFSRYD